MAQLKDTVVQGSLRVTDTLYTNLINGQGMSLTGAFPDGKNNAIVNITSTSTIADNKYQWGVNHLVPNGAVGSKTLLNTGIDNSTNKSAQFVFNYVNSSDTTLNYASIGLYNNPGLLKVDGTGKTTTTSLELTGELDPHKVLIGPASGTATAAPTWRTMNYQDSHGIEFIRGAWTAASGTWVGTTQDPELYEGKQIILFMPYAGSGNATLNLTLNGAAVGASGSTTTGAKNVYFESTTRFTTHKGQYAQLHLIYHENFSIGTGTYTGWWYVANRDTDNDYRARQNVIANTDANNRSLLLANPVVGTANNNTAYVSYRNDAIYANASNGTIYATAFNGLTLTSAATGFTIAGGTTSCTLTVGSSYTLAAACAKAVTDSTSASAISTGTSLPTERDIYYGLPTINNAHNYTSSTKIYAPTAGGATGNVLIGNGTTAAPVWNAGLILTGSAAASYVATFKGSTDATSSTGSVVIEGGLLVKKKIYLTKEIISSTTNYGTGLPTSGTEGQIFFQTSPTEYELPAGGTTGQALIKASNSDRDVEWGQVGGIMTPNTSTKYYVTGSSSNVQNTNPAIFDTAIYVQNHVLFGAAWNDYAEYREADIKEPGRVVIEQGDDSLQISTERLQFGAEIISDTYGFAIGETKKAKTPIATSGRVLAYPYEDREIFRQNIGKPVCSGPNGTVSIMTQEEYEKYGYCAIGTISAVPDYEEWGEKKVKVNGRIWIRVK